MKNIWITFLILDGLISLSPARVHYIKLDKGKHGCRFKNQDFEVNDAIQDPATCGVLVCQNTEGDVLNHFCQSPFPHQNCHNDGVLISEDFPECCWKCVAIGNC